MQFHGRRKGEGTLIDGNRSSILWVVTCDSGKDARTVLGAPGHRADLVHRRRERHRPVTADAAVGRPQTAHAAEGRRADDRTPCFRADCKRSQTGSDDRS